MIKYFFVALIFLVSTYTSANTLIQFMPTEDANDDRLNYIMALIDLALKKNPIPNDSIEFKPLPAAISYARAINEMKRDLFPNYFAPGGVNIEQLGTENLISVDFPLDHGLLSYRICFVSPKAKDKVAQVTSLDQLHSFTIAQGSSWPDIPILKANGFKVVEVPLYTSLFKMVVSNRVDLVCRGLNELRREKEQFQKYGALIDDQSFVLIYTMPYKLYFNQSSAALVKRIEVGLETARKDGSLHKLFLQYFQDDLVFAHLEKRKRFYLKSGYENSFSENYKRFLYDPFAKNY